MGVIVDSCKNTIKCCDSDDEGGYTRKYSRYIESDSDNGDNDNDDEENSEPEEKKKKLLLTLIISKLKQMIYLCNVIKVLGNSMKN